MMIRAIARLNVFNPPFEKVFGRGMHTSIRFWHIICNNTCTNSKSFEHFG
jgi:hypothetical protein